MKLWFGICSLLINFIGNIFIEFELFNMIKDILFLIYLLYFYLTL